MDRLFLNKTRTGDRIQELPFRAEGSSWSLNIRNDSQAEFIIPMSELPSSIRSNPGAHFKVLERSISVTNASDTSVKASYAIKSVNLNEREATIQIIGQSLVRSLELPIVRAIRRYRIDNNVGFWVPKGTHYEINLQIFNEIFSEDAKFAAPKNIYLVNNGSNIPGELWIKEWELTPYGDWVDQQAELIDGAYETYWKTQYVSGQGKRITNQVYMGDPNKEPNLWKNLSPLNLSLDDNSGVISFTATENFDDIGNFFYAQSLTRHPNPEWTAKIDLRGNGVNKPAGNDEFLTRFSKTKFNSELTEAELDKAIQDYLKYADVANRTFTLEVFGESWWNNLGRKLILTGSNRLPGYTAEMRIVDVKVSLSNPNISVLTVQPAELRVFPRVPQRLTDLTRDVANKEIENANWGLPPSGGGIGDDWDTPVIIPPEIPTTVSASEPSPYTDIKGVNDEWMKRSAMTQGPGRLTSAVWGTNTFTTGDDQLGPEGLSIFPHNQTKRFYGQSWVGLLLSHPGNTSVKTPYKLEFYRSRIFNSFPTSPNYPSDNNPLTDANSGLTGTGGKIGELSSTQLASQLMPYNVPPASGYNMTHSRLASGSFIVGKGDKTKLVAYFHHMQIWGSNDRTTTKSKVFAYEASLNLETGALGNWTLGDYPFESNNPTISYYPFPNQVDVYGPQNEFVSSTTPLQYYTNRDMGVNPPTNYTNNYWRDIKQGKYAISDRQTIKNYITGDMNVVAGPAVNVFKTENNTEERWSEQYKFNVYNNEMWAVNVSHTSYFVGKKVNNNNVELYMKFLMKSQIGNDGTPIEWEVIAAVYDFRGSFNTTRLEPTSSFFEFYGWKNYMFGGRIQKDIEYGVPSSVVPQGSIIAGKSGVSAGRVHYPDPNVTVPEFRQYGTPNVRKDYVAKYSAGSGSGLFEGYEFFLDFYNCTVSTNLSSDNLWLEKDEYTVPKWFIGISGNPTYGQTFHGRAMDAGTFTVSPSPSASYLLTGARRSDSEILDWFWRR